MKRISKGPVRGISFKLQEEERERKDNYVPEVSALNLDIVKVDKDTLQLMKSMNFENIAGVQLQEEQQNENRVVGRSDRPRRQ